MGNRGRDARRHEYPALSRLFDVTADYLLNDDYRSDDDLPKVREARADNVQLALVLLITLEVVVLVLQFVSFVVLQSDFFGVLSLIPFVAIIGGFDYSYRRNACSGDEESIHARKTFYKASVWLGAYFPVRFIVNNSLLLWPRPISFLVVEVAIVVAYLVAAVFMTLLIEKADRWHSCTRLIKSRKHDH